MPAILRSDVVGQTTEGQAARFDRALPARRAAPGFVMQASHPVDGGWRAVEIRQTRGDATQFFTAAIAPHLPKRARPKQSRAPWRDVVQA